MAKPTALNRLFAALESDDAAEVRAAIERLGERLRAGGLGQAPLDRIAETMATLARHRRQEIEDLLLVAAAVASGTAAAHGPRSRVIACALDARWRLDGACRHAPACVTRNPLA